MVLFEKVKVGEQLFHKNCLTCSVCKTPLTETTLSLVDGKYFCFQHALKVRPGTSLPAASSLDRARPRPSGLSIASHTRSVALVCCACRTPATV